MYPKKFSRSETDYVFATCRADEDYYRAQGYVGEGDAAALTAQQMADKKKPAKK